MVEIKSERIRREFKKYLDECKASAQELNKRIEKIGSIPEDEIDYDAASLLFAINEKLRGLLDSF